MSQLEYGIIRMHKAISGCTSSQSEYIQVYRLSSSPLQVGEAVDCWQFEMRVRPLCTSAGRSATAPGSPPKKKKNCDSFAVRSPPAPCDSNAESPGTDESMFESLSSAGSTCARHFVGVPDPMSEFCDSFAVWSPMAPCDPNAGSPGAYEGMPECSKVIADLLPVVLATAPDMTLLRDVVSCSCVCVRASVVYMYTSGRNVHSMPVRRMECGSPRGLDILQHSCCTSKAITTITVR